MAGSLNKVMLIGNLGADPEVRSFPNGGKVANLRIATSEQWKDRNTGERQERTEWHTVSIFSEGLINVVERFLRKGSKVFVEGQLQTRKWQDQSGQDKYSTEVVLQGFGGTLTTISAATEPQVKTLLEIPPSFALAAVVPLGRPVKQLTRLKRLAVEEFTFKERFGAERFSGN